MFLLPLGNGIAMVLGMQVGWSCGMDGKQQALISMAECQLLKSRRSDCLASSLCLACGLHRKRKVSAGLTDFEWCCRLHGQTQAVICCWHEAVSLLRSIQSALTGLYLNQYANYLNNQIEYKISHYSFPHRVLFQEVAFLLFIIILLERTPKVSTSTLEAHCFLSIKGQQVQAHSIFFTYEHYKCNESSVSVPHFIQGLSPVAGRAFSAKYILELRNDYLKLVHFARWP